MSVKVILNVVLTVLSLYLVFIVDSVLFWLIVIRLISWFDLIIFSLELI
jgi:hypothetical protein